MLNKTKRNKNFKKLSFFFKIIHFLKHIGYNFFFLYYCKNHITFWEIKWNQLNELKFWILYAYFYKIKKRNMKTYTLIKFHKIQRNYYYFYIIYILCTYVNNKSMNSITEIHTYGNFPIVNLPTRSVLGILLCFALLTENGSLENRRFAKRLIRQESIRVIPFDRYSIYFFCCHKNVNFIFITCV